MAEAQVMIVTGGSRGIGAAIARLAGRRGYHVCVNYHRSEAEAGRVADDIAATGGRAITVQADTSSEADVLRLFRQVDRELGPVTALVNNAGIPGPQGRVESLALADLLGVLGVNVVGCFLCAREAVRRMSTARGGPGGAIVNVSSRAAVLGGAGEWVHYAASKAALDALTIGLAREVGAEGIRVNAVRPGLIDTEIHAASGGGDRLSRLLGNVPLGRIGTPEEVATAVLWLLSDEARYTSGSILDIAGGR